VIRPDFSQSAGSLQTDGRIDRRTIRESMYRYCAIHCVVHMRKKRVVAVITREYPWTGATWWII